MFNIFRKDRSGKYFTEIIESVRPYFSSKDFSFDPDGNVFFQEKEGCYKLFELEYRPWIKNKEVKLSFGIQVKEVERIVWALFNKQAPTYSYTLFIDPELILSRRDIELVRFFLHPKSELARYQNKIISLFETYARPYFEQYSSIDSIEYLINRQPIPTDINKNEKYHSHLTDVLLSGVILACITKQVDVEEVISDNLSIIENEYGFFEMAEIEELISRLPSLI